MLGCAVRSGRVRDSWTGLRLGFDAGFSDTKRAQASNQCRLHELSLPSVVHRWPGPREVIVQQAASRGGREASTLDDSEPPRPVGGPPWEAGG
jgi:hypothetical protein